MNTRAELWKLDRRALVGIGLGVALSALVGWLQNAIDAPGPGDLRPALAIPVVFGLVFGPTVGLVVGAAGMAAGDALTYGLMWNWEFGAGLVGFLAGLIPAATARVSKWWLRSLTAIAMSILTILIGVSLSAVIDVWVANLTPDLAVSAELIPIATRELLGALPIVAIALIVWAWVDRAGVPAMRR